MGEFREHKGKGTRINHFVYSSAAGKFVPVTSNDGSNSNSEITRKVQEWMRDAFLPQGYPHSVSQDYLQYQLWDSLQAYCSSIGGALSLRATLEGLGVGESNANPLAATFIWLLKDGSGMISSILFAYWKGTQLDANNKQWRLFADIFCDLANLTTLLAPVLPIPFLATISIASIMNSLVGVAGGATKAAVSVHQAKNSNVSDIAAKERSQETVVNIGALLTSLALLPVFAATKLTTWITFLLFMTLHLIYNYKAMRSLKMETFNRPRLLYVLNKWVTREELPGVEETNNNETLFTGAAFNTHYLGFGYHMKLGYSYSEAVNICSKAISSPTNYLHDVIISKNKDRKFILLNDDKNKVLYVVFKEGITNEDQLLAFWSGYLYAANITKDVSISKSYIVERRLDLTDDAVKIATAVFPKLLEAIKSKGWLLQPLQIGADEWRLKV